MCQIFVLSVKEDIVWSQEGRPNNSLTDTAKQISLIRSLFLAKLYLLLRNLIFRLKVHVGAHFLNTYHGFEIIEFTSETITVVINMQLGE
jgi:hypothetical protein